jgi:hypothetical protein
LKLISKASLIILLIGLILSLVIAVPVMNFSLKTQVFHWICNKNKFLPWWNPIPCFMSQRANRKSKMTSETLIL